MDTGRTVIGLLAHVDAGKTTLSEALLFGAGAIRKQGRVDHRDAFLDTHALEKERGITIFLKQAELDISGRHFTLIDTPGHADFASEAERTVGILDHAVLVISAPEGVKAHTLTLWELLKASRVPAFVFVNKTDLPSPSKAAMIAELSSRLGDGFVDFTAEAPVRGENAAGFSEELMEEYLSSGRLSDESIASAVKKRQIFPVYFGSALKMTGVGALSDGLVRFTRTPDYPDEFAARVFKITHADGQRLTLMKITGGRLVSKQTLTNRAASVPEDEVWEEKADRILVYSGAKYSAVREAPAGTVAAVTGLTRTKAGEGLGRDAGGRGLKLAPMLSYSLVFPDGTNLFDAYRKLLSLAEEDPELDLNYDENRGEITALLMGEVQCEVLSRLVRDRFGLTMGFGPAKVMYKETVAGAAKGIGHFEPLRHFAHVEVLIEPAERGSGISFASEADPRELSPSWQRVILSCLAGKRHRGVLTGSPLTDVRITLLYGMAHLKHTEGGDFYNAASRAVRNALMRADSVLLEPYYEFRLEAPNDCVGRAMTDLKAMSAEFTLEGSDGDVSAVTGEAPVACMRDYAKTLAAYTKGRGTLSLKPAGMRPCHNAAEVEAGSGYDPEADLKNTPDSVFCAGGAGFTVKWHSVEAYMKKYSSAPNGKMPSKKPVFKNEDEELREIFERTYGRSDPSARLFDKKEKREEPKEETAERTDEYLLIDGYNVIFAWDELAAIARDSLDLARETLIRMMINFSAGRKGTTILVFDAYKVTGGVGRVDREGGVYVVYTRESELADVFIERAVRGLSNGKRSVRVVTSDGMEQLIVMGRGAVRVPSSAFYKEVALALDSMDEAIRRINREAKTYARISIPAESGE